MRLFCLVRDILQTCCLKVEWNRLFSLTSYRDTGIKVNEQGKYQRSEIETNMLHNNHVAYYFTIYEWKNEPAWKGNRCSLEEHDAGKLDLFQRLVQVCDPKSRGMEHHSAVRANFTCSPDAYDSDVFLCGFPNSVSVVCDVDDGCFLG